MMAQTSAIIDCLETFVPSASSAEVYKKLARHRDWSNKYNFFLHDSPTFCI